MHECNEDYWYNQWHLDTTTHKRMCIRNVKRIDDTYIRRVSKDVVFNPTQDQLTGGDGELPEVIRKVAVTNYGDTDSATGDTKVLTSSGEKTLEQWYNDNISNGSGGETLKGHESVLTDDKILNYSQENGLYMAPVARIIRHSVTKAKWRLKTKSGKEIIVTNDHSMIVFRDGVQMEVKPSEILKTDKILVLKR